jgi:hypothetical protein
MPVRCLSDVELARLSTWPGEIAEEDTVTFFTLAGDDLGWVRGFNRDENLLGVAVQLCTLPWLGWIPAELTGCPELARARLAAALGLVRAGTAELLAGYGGWQGPTRCDHRAQVLARFGAKPSKPERGNGPMGGIMWVVSGVGWPGCPLRWRVLRLAGRGGIAGDVD